MNLQQFICKKKKYQTAVEAVTAMNKILLAGKAGLLRYYLCGNCNYYHITRQKRRIK